MTRCREAILARGSGLEWVIVTSAATNPPPPIGKRLRLSDDAATHVRELIVSGQLKAGEFIRSEAVADELGISATPAREGLLILQSEGFVKGVPRRGFRVSPLSRKDISDTFDAQALLAGELAARAAVLLTRGEQEELRRLQSDLETAAGRHDLEEVEALNFRFHRLIYRAAQAPKIHWLLGATLVYAPRRFYSAIEGWADSTTHDHHGVLASLLDGDGERARATMSAHIRNAGRLLNEHLTDAERP